MKAKVLGAAAGLALSLAASETAKAQFAAPAYPVLIVPPPPAQGLVMPKPPKPAPPKPNPPADAQSPPPEAGQCYSGRTRTCP
ncbi:MAG: hypothetical protein JO288_23305 [Hyphomicrobiales bacterium]|nr:hypothetical protein [Hyphomicrobiales bacterium]